MVSQGRVAQPVNPKANRQPLKLNLHQRFGVLVVFTGDPIVPTKNRRRTVRLMTCTIANSFGRKTAAREALADEIGALFDGMLKLELEIHSYPGNRKVRCLNVKDRGQILSVELLSFQRLEVIPFFGTSSTFSNSM